MPYDEVNREWKLVTYDRFGARGGLLLFKRVLRNGEHEFFYDRIWPPQPRFGAFESLFIHGSYSTYYVLMHQSQHDVSGDDFCIQKSPEQAANWLITSDIELPPDLASLGVHACSRRVGPSQLTDDLQRVWDALNGRALTAKELSLELVGDSVNGDLIRKRMQALRRSGRTIENRRGIGYYRPDAPPMDRDDAA